MVNYQNQILRLLKAEGKLVKLKPKGTCVFVGDTHGDIDATETVLSRYLKDPYTIVFLGDYVDRGEHSRENVELLLSAKVQFPGRIFLLAGNHEGYKTLPFSPANFWESLNELEMEQFATIFEHMPLAAVTTNGVMSLHGVAPDVESIEDINNIAIGDDRWKQITWGDLYDTDGDFLGNIWGRPSYGRDYFYKTAKKIGFSVLIRAHQRDIDTISFNGRCITLLTSHSYKPQRTIALVNLEKPEIRNAHQIEVIEI